MYATLALRIRLRVFLICTIAFIFWLIFGPTTILRAQSNVTVYIPIAINQADTVLRKPAACKLTTQEQQVEQHLTGSAAQQRPHLRCNSILAQVARDRARDMATRDYFDHVNPDGLGPNALVEQAGYVLPAYYSDDPAANNIESIAAGHKDGREAWRGWMDSPGHRQHLLAEEPFYAEQVEYGIGHVFVAKGNKYGHYWVVLTAKPGGP